jgi:hypothetical protein
MVKNTKGIIYRFKIISNSSKIRTKIKIWSVFEKYYVSKNQNNSIAF